MARMVKYIHPNRRKGLPPSRTKKNHSPPNRKGAEVGRGIRNCSIIKLNGEPWFSWVLMSSAAWAKTGQSCWCCQIRLGEATSRATNPPSQGQGVSKARRFMVRISPTKTPAPQKNRVYLLRIPNPATTPIISQR